MILPFIHRHNGSEIKQRRCEVWTFSFILRCLTKLWKRPGRPAKVDDCRIVSLVKKNPFTTSIKITNTLEKVSVSKSTIFAHIQLNETKLVATQDYLKKKKKKWTNLQWPSQSLDVYPAEQLFSYWSRKAHKQAASEGLAKHFQGGNPEYGDIHGLQASTAKYFHPSIKNYGCT